MEVMKNMKNLAKVMVPVEVKENQLILQCERGGEAYQTGDRVKIKSAGQSSQVEGC